jgi:hypothetical protein
MQLFVRAHTPHMHTRRHERQARRHAYWLDFTNATGLKRQGNQQPRGCVEEGGGHVTGGGWGVEGGGQGWGQRGERVSCSHLNSSAKVGAEGSAPTSPRESSTTAATSGKARMARTVDAHRDSAKS